MKSKHQKQVEAIKRKEDSLLRELRTLERYHNERRDVIPVMKNIISLKKEIRLSKAKIGL